MAFFEDLSKNISDSAKISKLNGVISDENKRMDSLYLEIGKAYFELHKDDCEPRFEALVAEIKAIGSRIEGYNQQIKRIKGIFPCPNCGKDLMKSDAFCTGCGTRVAAPQPAANACSKCGAPMAAGAVFCTTCGTKVEAVSPAAAPVAPAPQMVVCTACGAPMVAGSAFCTKCGSKIMPAAPAPAPVAPAPVAPVPAPVASVPVAPAPAPVAPAPVAPVTAGEIPTEAPVQKSFDGICTNCGKQLPQGSKFCIYCGNKQG